MPLASKIDDRDRQKHGKRRQEVPRDYRHRAHTGEFFCPQIKPISWVVVHPLKHVAPMTTRSPLRLNPG